MSTAPTFGSQNLDQSSSIWPVAASMTIRNADWLALDSSGRVINAIATATTVYPGTALGAASGRANKLLGRSTQDSLSQTVDYLVSFQKSRGVAFEIPVVHSTRASAVVSINNVGVAYELTRVLGAAPDPVVVYYGLLISSTTNTKMKIVGFRLEDMPGWDTIAGTTGEIGVSGNSVVDPNVYVVVLEAQDVFGRA